MLTFKLLITHTYTISIHIFFVAKGVGFLASHSVAASQTLFFKELAVYASVGAGVT